MAHLSLKKKPRPSVAEFLKVRDVYQNLPGKITADGELLIDYFGEWITAAELEAVFPRPIVPDFNANLQNVDKTKMWIHT